MANDLEFGQLLRDFLGSNAVLLVEPSRTVRTAMATSLGHLGVPAMQIILTGSFQEAKDAWKQSKIKIGILVTDYMIGDGSGIELAEEIFADEDDIQKFAVFILTSSSHQSGVVEAAEGLADSYILKPFSDKVLKKYMEATFKKKLQPNPVAKLLQSLKSKLRASQYQEILTEVEVAIQQKVVDPTKSLLPILYSAQAYDGLKNFEKSEAYYLQILKIQPQNYTATYKLYEIYSATGRKQEAYRMLAQIGRLFPLSPQRLCEAIALAIETKHFSDVEGYYQVFTDIGERREDLVKTMAAALIVGAIYQFQNNRTKDGVALFKNGIVASKRNPNFILKAILYCVCYKEIDSASKFLKMFEPTDMEKEQFEISKFMMDYIDEKKDERAEQANIALGLKLIKSKSCPVQVYRALIKFGKDKKKDTLVKTASAAALERWKADYIDRAVFDLTE